MNITPQKNRFALPLAVAVSAHAFLFFGFRAPPVGLPPGVEKLPVALPPKTPPFVVDLEPPQGNENPAPYLRKEIPPQGPEIYTDVSVKDFRTDFTRVDPIDPTVITGKIPLNWTGPNGPGVNIGSLTFRPGDLDRLPKAEFRLAPQYPAHLRAAGISGEVVVDFMVDELGRVSDVHVLRSTHPEFESPTLKAVVKWRFEPGKRHGKAVRYRMAQPVHFTLGD